MSDESSDGRRFRLSKIMDHSTRESLVIEVGQRLRGSEVVAALKRLSCCCPLPRTIRVDNGTELASKILDQWAYMLK